jgi:hypothetical protein
MHLSEDGHHEAHFALIGDCSIHGRCHGTVPFVTTNSEESRSIPRWSHTAQCLTLVRSGAETIVVGEVLRLAAIGEGW